MARKKSRILIAVPPVLTALLVALAVHSHAGVTLDGTLGKSGPITGPNYAITADLGKQVGSNLFHSFSQFNLVKGDIATFSGPTNIANIISRVTGGSASSIDGTIRSTINGANMYLINPYGVMFGPNANLDLSGSFHVSTADYLKLGADGRFDAATPANSILTVSPPSAFGFVSAKPAAITVKGTGSEYAFTEYGLNGLYVPGGNGISMIGGDITFTSGILDNQTVPFYLLARRGRLNLASVASGGEVVIENNSLTMNGFSALGNIVLEAGGTIDLTPYNLIGEAGTIFFRGNNLHANKVQLNTYSNDGFYKGGNVDVRLSGSMVLDQATGLFASGSQYYKADQITVANGSMFIGFGEKDTVLDVNRLTITGEDSAVKTIYRGTGKGAGITIQAAESVTVGNGSFFWSAVISTASFSDGDAGMIAITSPSILLSNYGYIQSSSSVLDTTPADSGNILLHAKNIVIENGSGIKGNAGDMFVNSLGKSSDITITTDTLTMKGGSSYLDYVSITSNSYGPETGNITINAADKIIMDGNSKFQGASITANATSGTGGTISLNAGEMLLHKGVFIGATIEDGTGGNIKLSANNILFQGGEISTGVSAKGNAGNISVAVKEKLTIGGNTSSTSSVDTISQLDSLALKAGNAGSVTVSAKEVIIGSKGKIVVTTEDTSGLPTGKGGDITITANAVTLETGEILAYTQGSGDAGNIAITTDMLALDGKGAKISAATFSSGQGGNLKIKAADSVRLSNIGEISVHAEKGSTGNAGSVTIETEKLTVDHSIISGVTMGAGRGGNLTIKALDSINLIQGGIIAVSTIYGSGDAGTATLETKTLNVDANGQITGATGSSGKGGNISIKASESVNLTNGGVVFVQSDPDGTGDAGTAVIATKKLNIDGTDSRVVGSTYSNGKGGSLAINASESVSLSNGGGIIVQAEPGSSGDAGAAAVETGQLTITGRNSVISGSTYSSGKGGSLLVKASGSINLSDLGGIYVSAEEGTGDAGTANIAAGQLNLAGNASISSGSLGSGKAGDLHLTVRDAIRLANSSITTSTSNADGGSITIIDPVLIDMQNSQITTSVKGGEGNGGNITIAAKQLVVDHSNIIANAEGGNGGNISLITRAMLQSVSGSTISASSKLGISGTVSISSPLVDIGAGLAAMPDTIVDMNTLTPKRCASNADEISSFSVLECSSAITNPDKPVITP